MATVLDDLAQVQSLEELYPRLNDQNIQAGWSKPEPSLYPEPYKNFAPVKWSWETGRAALDAAGRLISTELAERRNLILYNPAAEYRYPTVRTMITAYQMILPGETARSHRHTPNALRLILEGEGAYTIVNGERLDMHVNDVLLTPNWHWHGHGSDSDVPCYWLDCLDVPFVHLIDPMFFETHPDGFEEVTIRPSSSPYIFPWSQVDADLNRTPPDPSGRFGRRVQLGDPAMATIALYMQRMEGGMKTPSLQTTASQVFCAVEGAGATIVDGERFEWRRGDVIAVPSWRPFEHHVAEDATLFLMTDEPVLKAFNWLRTTG